MRKNPLAWPLFSFQTIPGIEHLCPSQKEQIRLFLKASVLSSVPGKVKNACRRTCPPPVLQVDTVTQVTRPPKPLTVSLTSPFELLSWSHCQGLVQAPMARLDHLNSESVGTLPTPTPIALMLPAWALPASLIAGAGAP